MGREVDVGAMYITDDGKTRIYITLTEGRTSPMLGCCPNGTVTVDWGDGSTPDVLTGTSVTAAKWTPTHEYAAPGDYVITLAVNGEMGFYGSTSTTAGAGSGFLRYSDGTDYRNIAYQSSIKKIEIGGGVTSMGAGTFMNCYSMTSVSIPNSITDIGGSACYNCYSMQSVSIPNRVTSFGSMVFQNCYSVQSISVPNGVTNFAAFVFYNCYSMARLIIPDNVTGIGNYTFYYCHSITRVIVPGSVKSIGTYAFYYQYGVRYYDFTRHTAVPTLNNVNAFTGISADCEIRVPAALVDQWKALTNWSAYADYIVGV